MSEYYEWLEEVTEILEPKGMLPDENNDGWAFLFENGATPDQAIREMLNG